MKRPVVYLTLGDNSPTTVFQSKVGGKPYLPIGAEYPKNRKTGNPLTLLAQINFAEMPPMPDFPTQGILQFFVDRDDDKYGKGSDDEIPYENYYYHSDEELYEKNFITRVGYDVIYYPEILPENQLQSDFSNYPTSEYNRVAIYSVVNGEFPITFQPVKEEEIGYETRTDSGHKINGNAGFPQGDELGMVLHRENWYDKHIVLLQLDSESAKEGNEKIDKVMWGDWGIGNFLIKPEYLKNLDFSKVVYCWAGY